jgi:hypothetical protein
MPTPSTLLRQRDPQLVPLTVGRRTRTGSSYPAAFEIEDAKAV